MKPRSDNGMPTSGALLHQKMIELPSTPTTALATLPAPIPFVKMSDVVEWGVLTVGAISGVGMAALTFLVGMHVGGVVGMLTFLAGVGLGAPVSLFCGSVLTQAVRAAAARGSMQVRVLASPSLVRRGRAVDVIVTSARPFASTPSVRLVRRRFGAREVVAVANVGAALRVPEDATPTSRGVTWAVEIEGDAERFGNVTAEAPVEVVD